MAAVSAGESCVNWELLEGLVKRAVRAVNVEMIIDRLVVFRRMSRTGGSGF